MKATFTLIVAALIFTTFLEENMLAAETICQDIADLYIDEWYPDENLNYHDRIVLATNKNTHHGISRGLFLFSIPDELVAGDIKTASVYFSGCSHCGGGKGGLVGFYALNEPFDETTDTWNSLSGGNWDDTIYSQAVLPEGSDWNEAIDGEPPPDVTGFDVTALIKGNLEKARTNGIMIRFYDEHQDPYTHQNVASRETTDPLDFFPYLVITTQESEPFCPAEIAFIDDQETLELLRRFRDVILSKTPEGVCCIRLYYHYAETISTLLINDSILRGEIKNVIDDILPDVKRVLKSNEGSTIKK